MSDAMFAGLPRFDDGAARAPGDWRRSLEDGAPVPRPVREVPAAKEAAAEPKPAAPEPPPRPSDLTQLEASLKSLAGRLDRIEQDARAQALQAVQAMAAKLFPELGRRFLAEEIGRSLPKLVPASAAVIEIRAGEELARWIEELVSRTPGLENRCTVLPSADGAPGQAEISWQSGGLSFDFDALLATLEAQLHPTQTTTTE